jgi:ribose transport system permease protein
MMNNRTTGIWKTLGRQYYLFSLILLVIAVIINASLQKNFFKPVALNGMLITFLPSILLALGQVIVIIGGGIDLSVASIVTMVNTILVTNMGAEVTPQQVWVAMAIGLGAGILAGVLNGVCVAFLRFQPLVTTFATTSIFTGIAIYVLPTPGGAVPHFFMEPLRAKPLGIITPFWVILAFLLLWLYLRNTKFGRFLFASGGQPVSAYYSAVPVDWIRFTTYVISGFLAALASLSQTMNFGNGSPLVSGDLTMSSIVSVVLGGIPLSGGTGGLVGAVIGGFILIMIQNIISFANVPNWWQTLVKGIIVVFALAGPGIIRVIRRK